ncbi:MAG: GTP cyclohydrolase I [Lautropia sp.]
MNSKVTALVAPMDAQKGDGRPMSAVIRDRIRAAGHRFHANDNISAFIHSDEERTALREELTRAMDLVLQALVIDVDSDHNTRDTARRVAKLYLDEVFAGRYVDAPSLTEFPNVEKLDELIVVGPITVRSACSHHLCPIMGRLWIGILPNAGSNLIGLSKFARLAEWVFSRPQIQEEAVKMLADQIEERLAPDGLAVVIEGEHFCMSWRGVKDNGSRMISSIMRGALLRDQSLRKEFLELIRR